jgi:hypothetical protein
LFNTAKIDEDFNEDEKYHINVMLAEMGISEKEAKEKQQSTDEIISFFAKAATKIKKIVFLEIISLVFVDGQFTEEEKELVDLIKEKIGLSQEFYSAAEEWINKIIPLYKRGFELIED